MGRWLARSGFVLALILLLLSTPPVRTGPINISREGFNAALAKWNSSNVAEYEETVREGMPNRPIGGWKMVVDIDHTSGKAVENVTHVENLDGSPIDDNGIGFAKALTVGALFNGLDKLLEHPDADGDVDPPVVSYIVVQFDPTRGYVSSVKFRAFPLGNDVSYDATPGLLSVDELTILK